MPMMFVRPLIAGKDLTTIVKTDVPTTKMDTPLADLLDAVSTTSVPYAVIDDQKRLRGIIISRCRSWRTLRTGGQCQCLIF